MADALEAGEKREKVVAKKAQSGFAAGKRHVLLLEPNDIQVREISSFDPAKKGTIAELHRATQHDISGAKPVTGSLNQSGHYLGGNHLLHCEISEEPAAFDSPADRQRLVNMLTPAWSDSMAGKNGYVKGWPGIAGYTCVVISNYLIANSALEVDGFQPNGDVKAFFTDGFRHKRWSASHCNWPDGHEPGATKGVAGLAPKGVKFTQHFIDGSKRDKIRALLKDGLGRSRIIHVRRGDGGHSFTMAFDGSDWIRIDSESVVTRSDVGRNSHKLNPDLLTFDGPSTANRGVGIKYLTYFTAGKG